MQPGPATSRQDVGYKNTSYGATINADSDDEESVDEPKKRDMSKVECYNCHKLGHIYRFCPEKKKKNCEKIAYSLTDAISYAAQRGILTENDGVLDSGSNVHLCNNKDWCSDVTEVDEDLDRVGGRTNVTLRGKLPQFGECVIVKHRVSLLSLGKLEETAKDIIYVKRASFTIVWQDDSTTTFNFNKDCNLYVCKMHTFVTNQNHFVYNVATVHRNKLGYSKHDNTKADIILDFQRKLGYPSTNEIINTINTGGVMHLNATSTDALNCERIYGPNATYLKGVSTDSGAVGTLSEELCATMKGPQVLHSDIFFFDWEFFLVSVAKPMNLILTNKLESRSMDKDIRVQLENQIATLNERGFPVKTVFGDGEFKPLHGSIIRGAKVYATASAEPTAERNGGVLKNRARSVKASVPWRVPPSMIKDLVKFCTMMINWVPRLGGVGTCARQIIDGRKLDYRDLKLGWGDYVQAYDKNLKRKNDVNTPHTFACIALYPLFNGKGSWRLMKLGNMERITSDNFTLLPTSDDVIKRINEIAATEIASRGRNGRRNPAMEVEVEVQQEPEVLNRVLVDGILQPIIPEDPRVEIFPEQERVPEDPVEYTVEPITEEDPIDDMQENVAMFCFGQMSWGESMRKNPEMTSAGGTKEIRQILDKNVLEFKHYRDITHEEKKEIIPSHLTCKEKMDKDIVTEMKLRLVGGGNKQVEKEYENFYSSTIKTSSVFTILAEAASKKLHLKSMDIEGAYLEADMDDTIVHMRINNKVADMFIKERPELKEFLHNGALFVKLKKALYGIIQAALKWKEKLTAELVKLGYVQCTEDDCIFYKTIDGYMMKIGVYVDDLLLSHKTKAIIDREILAIGSRFSGYKESDGINFKFLGMKVARNSNMDVMLSMKDYTKKICCEHDIDFVSTLPGTKDFFEEDDSARIPEDERIIFHTTTAECLYLSKRVRTDILVNTSFLSSRVTCATENNKDQLYKLMCYLYGTMDRGIIYRGGGSMEPLVYGDAAFMVHDDTRSRGGDLVIISGGVIAAHSSKQTIITKSSTESELVNLDNTVVSALESRRLLIALGENKKATRVLQDNNSVLALIKRGKPISQRTKHISMRYFSVCEHIKNKEIEVVWCPTGDMLADILTKQLTGKLFKKMRNIIAPVIEEKYL